MESFQGKTKLVNFSGGIDSTLMALDLLESGSKDVMLHHVTLQAGLYRHQHELEACRNIIKEFRKKYTFGYIETAVDVRNFKRTYDSLITLQMGTTIAYANPKITSLYFGLNKDDTSAFFDYQAVVDAPFEGSGPKIIIPLREIPKAEVITRLQSYGNIIDMCFWCRRDQKSADACGNCASCRQYKNAIS